MSKRVELDFTTLSGYSELTPGAHTAKFKAKATDILSSSFSGSLNIVKFNNPQNYLTFRRSASFTLTGNLYHNGMLIYSTDKITWKKWDQSAITAVRDSYDNYYYVYLAGISNAYVRASSPNQSGIILSNEVSCSGNIESLLDYPTVDIGNHPTMDTYCFANLFEGCTNLKTAPTLGSPALSNYCYQAMFKNSGIVDCPTLSATSLKEGCYQEMFMGCTYLRTITNLPAQVLDKQCYESMFEGCTRLQSIGSISAVYYAQYSCARMFYGCTSLTSSKAFGSQYQTSSNFTSSYCCAQMFAGCTSITTIGNIYFKDWASGAFDGLYEGCSSLMVSTTKTGAYQHSYKVPEATGSTSIANNFFANTGGTYKGYAGRSTTYYLQTTPIR